MFNTNEMKQIIFDKKQQHYYQSKIFFSIKHFDKYMFVKKKSNFINDFNNFEKSLNKEFLISRDERKIARK